MQYSPPPLFKQGASARAKVVVFSCLAIALLLTDGRFQTLSTVRQAIGTVLLPLQTLALAPRDTLYAVGGYFSSLNQLQKENEQLRQQQVVSGLVLQQGRYLEAENAWLRQLLGASQQMPVPSVLGQVLYDTRDAFERKLVLDRGQQHGVRRGQPVIDDQGVIGQISRVFPFTSEVTLLTDKNQAIAVQVLRSGVRSVIYGRGQPDVLDLRFVTTNADIRRGDVLMTSGIDGVYPGGLAVAMVTEIELKSGDSFAQITCRPVAGISRHQQLLILLMAPPPPLEQEDVTALEEIPKKDGADKAGIELEAKLAASSATKPSSASPVTRNPAPKPAAAPAKPTAASAQSAKP